MDDWKIPFYRYHTIYVKALLASFCKDTLDDFWHVERKYCLDFTSLLVGIGYSFHLRFRVCFACKIKKGEMRWKKPKVYVPKFL